MVDAERLVADVAIVVMGTDALAEGTLADSQFRNALASGVAAGAYEIQLNLIAQTVLEMPR
jgi:alkylation response protein AidB-like acyl-CoA dehydrogenase